MIKVNLLRDISGGGGGPGIAQDEPGLLTKIAGDTSEIDRFDFGVKVTLLVVPIILMFGYRQFLISRAQAQHSELAKEQKEMDANLHKFDAALKDIEKFDEEKRKFNSQLEIIRTLSRERLKIVKSMDALQKIVPNAAWLHSLKIKGDKVEIEGFAVNDSVVSEVILQLSTSIFFSHVILMDSVEAPTPEGTVKKFKLKCDLEKI